MIGGRIQRLQRPIITRGLVSRWMCGPQDTLDHATGVGDGTDSGNLSWEDNRSFSGVQCDGTLAGAITDCGDLTTYQFIHNTGVVSISFTLRIPEAADRHGILGNAASSADPGFFLLWRNVQNLGYGAVQFNLLPDNSGRYVTTGTTDDHMADIGETHNFCVVSDKTVRNIVWWYRDGVEINSSWRGVSTNGPTAPPAGLALRTLMLGVVNHSTPITGSARLSDMRIYNVALTADEAIAITAGRG